MKDLLRWCWAALGQTSLIDWLLGLFQSSIFGVLLAVLAWLVDLPIILSGLIAFCVAVVIWTLRELYACIRRIERIATENPKVKYLRADKASYIKGEPVRPSVERSAFIKCRISGEVADSYNISSMVDMGTGLLGINFSADFPTNNVIVSVVGVPPRNLRTVSVNRAGVVVSYDEDKDATLALKLTEA